MGNSESRAASFKKSLEAAGYSVVWKPKKAVVPWATIEALPAIAADTLLVIFRELGGVPAHHAALAPGGWDMQADQVLIEFDEGLHFNRYRALSLATPWAPDLPWSTVYGDYSTGMEGMCLSAGKHGGKWASPSSDRTFGGSDEKGVLEPLGPSRWKQRALYDAIKDAYALYSPEVSLARVSIHDRIGGMNVNQATKKDILRSRKH
ncbi:DUF7255 family protein [Pseudarthrobacter sp. LT1]|uniref:DUF7255 family protein n=1 Tax=Pseudarthrobacter sp. LT1 TaxID=3111450 RepID=UPI002D77BD85|nr:hypothetical protein [Pseudarthrobacter sp. LT1]WRT15637.1 hypothetical protein VIK36_09240 [Pseudarthrobacter sp. LT1]